VCLAALYLGGGNSNVGQHADDSDFFCAFPQSLQADADTIPQTAQQSLPFTYFKIHYSPVIPNLTLDSLSY
jgi:hypothetical protein